MLQISHHKKTRSHHVGDWTLRVSTYLQLFLLKNIKMVGRQSLITVASCVVAITSPVTGMANGTGTLNASGLKSCSTSMDGRLPTFIPSDFSFSGNVRRYYIAAEEVEWDYAPTGWDNWLGVRAEQTNSLGSLVLIISFRFLWESPREPTLLVIMPLEQNG